MTEIPQQRGDDWKPRPDPTVLTTQALDREVKALKDLLELRIEAEATSRKQQIESVYAAIELQTQLRAEMKESTTRELELIERQRVEQKADTSLAVAAALQAAKEAVKEQTTASALSINKSENATNEQLKQLNVTFTTAIQGVGGQINDLKDRINKVENVEAAHFGRAGGGSSAALWFVLTATIIISVVSIILEVSIIR